MSVEKRIINGKVKYVVRVYAGTVNGKKKYIFETKDKKSEADARERQLKNFKSNKVDISISDKVLFEEVCNKYLDHISKKLKDNTVRSYRSKISTWISPQLGLLQIGGINQITINSFIVSIEREGASQQTINYCLIVLANIFKYASEGVSKYILHNPMTDFKYDFYMRHVKNVKYWTNEKTNMFLDKARQDEYFNFFALVLNTGLRKSEALALTRNDIDLDTGFLTVSSQLSVYIPKVNEPTFEMMTYFLNTPKSAKSRHIPLNKVALEIVKDLIVKSEGNHFLFKSSIRRQSCVVLKRGVRPVMITASIANAHTINDHMTALALKSGVENIGPHGLRHTFAANFIMNGGSIYDLKQILGHASITSTEIYAHLSENYLKRAINIVSYDRGNKGK